MTEGDARTVAMLVLSRKFAEFKAGNWIITGVEEFDTAWAFYYNNRAFVETGEIRHALGGNGPLIVPKGGEHAWLAWSGADIASQVAQGRSAFER